MGSLVSTREGCSGAGGPSWGSKEVSPGGECLGTAMPATIARGQERIVLA